MVYAGSRGAPEIDVDEFDRRLNAGEVGVLDVRENWEFARGRVPGVIHIPLGELPARLGELPKDKPLMVVCAHGNRSLKAARLLLDGGFSGAASVRGGTAAWIESGRAVETDHAW